MRNIFIDESGTNKNIGFSTIAAVTISRDDSVELNENILRAESRIGIDFFHWSRHKWPVRQNPLKSNIFLEQTLQAIARERIAGKITIDGEKSRAYERRIKRILHENGLRMRLLSVTRDETAPALRLADGIAGLTRYHFDNPENVRSRELFQFLQNTFEVKIHHISPLETQAFTIKG